ncbi:hypothetical protein MA16_Dca022223 [Dendrobium catenatum]|uniref:Josephin-like protein n=1 Tax=Dendrobium catenatum TaxID=906689 RepID=A0A2I0VS88_9ASPA|nr:hypothetical protein MA16_Dca022223 [Dendrobium catenatum]
MPTMTRKGNIKRVGFSPHELGDYRTVITHKSCLDSEAIVRACPSSNAAARRKHNNMQKGTSSSSSPASRIFQSVSANMARAIRHLFTKKRSLASSSGGHADQITSIQSSTINFVPHRDSHHSEAFEDCIEFINSSYRKSV